MSWERALMASVAGVAVRDYVEYDPECKDKEELGHYFSAWAWIFDPTQDQDHIFSFRFVMDYLGIDPATARAAIFRKRSAFLRQK